MALASTPTRSLTWLAVPLCAQLLAAAAIPWLHDESLLVVVVGAALAIMFGSWSAYAIVRTRDLRRQRRDAKQRRGHGEATLRRFADSLSAQD